MSAANKLVIVLFTAALAACRNQADDANIVITNDIPPNAEVETLPPDESAATPTDELRNGADDPDVVDQSANTSD